jgi:ParB family chromosome partitioning protein
MDDKMRIENVPVTAIRVLGRTRKVSDAALDVLRQSYEDHGGFTTPIHVRKVKKGFELIDGAHRLTLAGQLGLEVIPARIWECTQDQAKFFEVDANVALAHLTPVALARSLAVRHEAYVKLHPETAQGAAGGKARQGQQPTEMSFADFVGAVLGVTPRQVQRIVRAGRALAPDQASALEDAPRRVTMDDLYELAKIQNSGERYYVIDALAGGKTKKASAARKAYLVERGEGPAPKEEKDAAHRRLVDAFKRAPKVARRRFVEDHADELRALLDEIEGGV